MVDPKTVERFISRLEEVYAPYKDAVRQEVAIFFSKASEAALKAIYKGVREVYPNTYGKPPDIKHLNDAYQDYLKGVADEYLYTALPDPDFEHRQRTMTEEEKQEGAEFLRRLLRGMQVGRHPQEIYQKWEEERDDVW